MFEYKVKSGDDIIRQGDDGDNFYVVESGLYNIFVNTANGNQLVGKCEDSGSFGELALMYNSKFLLQNPKGLPQFQPFSLLLSVSAFHFLAVK